jgi:hypothetical protein
MAEKFSKEMQEMLDYYQQETIENYLDNRKGKEWE